jgi:hypothetical protein
MYEKARAFGEADIGQLTRPTWSTGPKSEDICTSQQTSSRRGMIPTLINKHMAGCHVE